MQFFVVGTAILLVVVSLILLRRHQRHPAGALVSLQHPSGWSAATVDLLEASFRQPDGTTRIGVDWAVELTRGAEKVRVFQRTYLELSRDPDPPVSYVAQVVLTRVMERIAQGWDPHTFQLAQLQEQAILVRRPAMGAARGGAPGA